MCSRVCVCVCVCAPYARRLTQHLVPIISVNSSLSGTEAICWCYSNCLSWCLCPDNPSSSSFTCTNIWTGPTCCSTACCDEILLKRSRRRIATVTEEKVKAEVAEQLYGWRENRCHSHSLTGRLAAWPPPWPHMWCRRRSDGEKSTRPSPYQPNAYHPPPAPAAQEPQLNPAEDATRTLTHACEYS